MSPDTTTDAIARMRVANPASAVTLREEIGEEELRRAMAAAIAAGDSPGQPVPAGEAAASGFRAPRPSRGRSGARRWALAAGFAAVCAAALVALLGGAPGGGGHPTFAAAAIEVAEANPRLLVTAPGWQVTHAGGFTLHEGEVVFGDGRHRFTVHWYPARAYRSYLHDRADVSRPVRSRLLGRTATTVHYFAAEYATMLAPRGPVFVEVRGRLDSRAEYDAVLRSLRPVSIDAWLGAMPPSVVRPEARAAAISRMLRGVPLPPGFDAGRLAGKDVALDHRELGDEVAGKVACGWVGSWLAATRAGDAPGAREAVAAMASVRDWPMVRDPRLRTPWSGNLKLIAGEIAHDRLDQGAAGEVVDPDGSGYALGPAWAVALNCRGRYWRHALPR